MLLTLTRIPRGRDVHGSRIVVQKQSRRACANNPDALQDGAPPHQHSECIVVLNTQSTALFLTESNLQATSVEDRTISSEVCDCSISRTIRKHMILALTYSAQRSRSISAISLRADIRYYIILCPTFFNWTTLFSGLPFNKRGGTGGRRLCLT